MGAYTNNHKYILTYLRLNNLHSDLGTCRSHLLALRLPEPSGECGIQLGIVIGTCQSRGGLDAFLLYCDTCKVDEVAE